MSFSPGESTRFIGRRQELSDVRALLSTSRVVTLTGIGGAGKTRIAQRLAVELGAIYPDGIWIVELADLLNPQLLGHALAETLGLQVHTGELDLNQVVDFLAGRRALLVLDNCEHISGPAADLVVTLLERCPDLQILATSRQPLGLAGEAIFRVPPLSVPEQGAALSTIALGQFESVALFVDRATRTMSDFRLDPTNGPAVAQLVRTLEGIPLALELAAPWVRVLSPADIVTRLSDRYELLTAGFRDAPARQQSLMASVDWSYDLCTVEEQTLWRRLAVFTGGFELEAAEEVCSDEVVPKSAMLDLVASLLDKSIIARDTSDSTRYRMLETIRQYGVAKLDDEGALCQWRNRHLDYVADLCARLEAEWIGPHQRRWIDRFRAEHPNVRAALEHASDSDELAPVALRMLHQLEQYWICSGRLSEARQWCERALAPGAGSDAERALAMRLCVWFGSLQMDLDYAQGFVDLAEPLARASGDPVAWGYHQYGAGMLATWRGEVDRGIPLLLEGIETFRSCGHRNGEVNLLFLTGMCMAFAERPDDGAALNRECLTLTEPRGEQFMRSYALWALGLDALFQGRFDEALALEHEALTLKWAVQDQLGVALVTEAVAWICAATGEGERGATLLGAADAIWQVIGMSLTTLPYISIRREEGEQLARGVLTTAGFEEAFAAGQEMPRETAVDLALGRMVDAGPDPAEDNPLTPRETEVADLLGEGLSNKDIAARLVISQRTVTGHVENILHKLGFSSRAQVAAWVVSRRQA